MYKLTRREWMGKGLTGLVLFGFSGLLLDVWVSASRFSSTHWVQIADLNNLPGEGVYPFPSDNIALVINDGRIAAISLECTHLGCTVNAVDEGFFCPCHGSEFGPRGELYSGPAPKPLPWHIIRIKDNQIWFHSGRKTESPKWLSAQVATNRKV